ncbi:MAG TPA: recombinase family protein, partial [Acidimicrobiia bacterium]|nr:recombinase family protein [Acidimicrobiia bacterium]
MKKPTPTAPRRAVGYVRISKDRDDETSTTTQEQRIRAYCTAHGIDLVDVIVEPGRSGYQTSRSSRCRVRCNT